MEDTRIKNDSVDQTGRRARNVSTRVLFKKMQRMRTRQIEQKANVVMFHVGHHEEGKGSGCSKSGYRIPIVTVVRS